MKKIPTLFERDPDNPRRLLDVRRVSVPFNTVATAKFDGSCVLFDENGYWWARRQVKPGKSAPENFALVERDEVTGNQFGWVPVTDDPQWKHHWSAIGEHRRTLPLGYGPKPGSTYEAVGPHFQGDPHNMLIDTLVEHGAVVLPDDFHIGLPIEQMEAEMTELVYEGVVWYCDGQPIAKIKRRDFGLPWPVTS